MLHDDGASVYYMQRTLVTRARVYWCVYAERATRAVFANGSVCDRMRRRFSMPIVWQPGKYESLFTNNKLSTVDII